MDAKREVNNQKPNQVQPSFFRQNGVTIGCLVLSVALLAISIATRVDDFLNVGKEAAHYMTIGSALFTGALLVRVFTHERTHFNEKIYRLCQIMGIAVIALNLGLNFHQMNENFDLFALGALMLLGSQAIKYRWRLEPHENKLIVLGAVVSIALLAIGISSRIVDFWEMGAECANELTTIGALTASLTLAAFLKKKYSLDLKASTALFAMIFGVVAVALGVGIYYPAIDQTDALVTYGCGAAITFMGSLFLCLKMDDHDEPILVKPYEPRSEPTYLPIPGGEQAADPLVLETFPCTFCGQEPEPKQMQRIEGELRFTCTLCNHTNKQEEDSSAS